MTPDSQFSILAAQRQNPASNLIEAGEEKSDRVEISLAELVEILDAELYQYRELLRLLQAQRESFAANDIGSFEEISKQQGTAVLKVKTLEEARKSIVSRLAQYLGVSGEMLTLAKLATLVDERYSKQCAACQKEILFLIKELESLKESNAYLMQQALHYVSGVLRIFASAHNTDFAYSNSGQTEYQSQKGKYVSGWG